MPTATSAAPFDETIAAAIRGTKAGNPAREGRGARVSVTHDKPKKGAPAGSSDAQTPVAAKPVMSWPTSTTSPVPALVELPLSEMSTSLLTGKLTSRSADAVSSESAGALTGASTAALRMEGSLGSGEGGSTGLMKSADLSSSYKANAASMGHTTSVSPESASESGRTADLGVAGVQSAQTQITADALARMAPGNFADAADGPSGAGDSGAAHIPATAGLKDQGNHASGPNGVALSATAMPQMPVLPGLLVSLPNVAAELGPGTTGSMLPAKMASSNPTSRSGASSPTGMAEKESPHSGELRGKRKTEGEAGSSSTNVISNSLPRAKSLESSATAYRDVAAGHRSAELAEVQQHVPVSQMAGSDRASTAPADRAGVPGLSGQDHASARASTAEGTTMPVVNSAQLIQSMHHSEMRLGMRSAEFGDISISTSLNHQSLSTQISINHPELGRALAIHLRRSRRSSVPHTVCRHGCRFTLKTLLQAAPQGSRQEGARGNRVVATAHPW